MLIHAAVGSAGGVGTGGIGVRSCTVRQVSTHGARPDTDLRARLRVSGNTGRFTLLFKTVSDTVSRAVPRVHPDA